MKESSSDMCTYHGMPCQILVNKKKLFTAIVDISVTTYYANLEDNNGYIYRRFEKDRRADLKIKITQNDFYNIFAASTLPIETLLDVAPMSDNKPSDFTIRLMGVITGCTLHENDDVTLSFQGSQINPGDEHQSIYQDDATMGKLPPPPPPKPKNIEKVGAWDDDISYKKSTKHQCEKCEYQHDPDNCAQDIGDYIGQGCVGFSPKEKLIIKQDKTRKVSYY